VRRCSWRLDAPPNCRSGTTEFFQGKLSDSKAPPAIRPAVRVGTLIQTAAKSRVDLVLGAETRSCRPSTERNWVRIWDNAPLGIDKLSVIETGTEVVTDRQLELKAGHINGSVDRMSAGSKYEVKMPHGIAGIRGTAYDLTGEGDVKVWSGSVVLACVAPMARRRRKSLWANRILTPALACYLQLAGYGKTRRPQGDSEPPEVGSR
jgi:hypothetical protein